MQKSLRSFIHEKIPLDLRVELDLISRRRDLKGEEKPEEIIKSLRNYDIGDISQLGPGTNRYGLKLDGFVLKIATDKDGKIDNLKEFKMAKWLAPNVPMTYEVSENGLLLVAEYGLPFQSYTEMLRYSDQIREILERWSSAGFLIGDAGICSKNYANWALRVATNELICIDFAYIYDVSSELFICRHCHSNSMLIPNKDFTKLICPNPACQREVLFEDIRTMISKSQHLQEIGDLSEDGYIMTQSGVLTELTESRSNYLAKMRGRKKKTQEKKVDVDIVPEHCEGTDNKQTETEEDMTMFKNEVNIQAIQNLPDHPFSGLVVSGITMTAADTSAVVAADNDVSDMDTAVDNTSQVVFTAEVCTGIHYTSAEPIDEEEQPVEDPDDDSDDGEEISVATTADMDEATPAVVETESFSHKFCNESNKALSIFSNKLAECLRANNLYGNIKSYIKTKEVYEGAFYDALAKAIFRAFADYLSFSEIEVPNPKTDGTHREFTAVYEIVNDWPANIPASHTLRIIDRVYHTRQINSAEPISFVEAYNDVYWQYDVDNYDCNPGFWMPTQLMDAIGSRIQTKLRLPANAISVMISNIVDLWQDDVRRRHGHDDEDESHDDMDSQDDVDEPIDEEEQPVEDPDDDSDDDSDDGEEISVATTADMDEEESHEDSIVGSYQMRGADDESSTVDDEDDGDYEEGSDANDGFLRLEIYQDDDYDIIKILTDDPFSANVIPIYGNLDNVDTASQSDKIIDARNGYWDWLTNFAPGLMFRAKDPEEYLEYNGVGSADNLHEEQGHVVILGNDPATGDTIMGIYMVGGIYVVDDDFERIPMFNEDVLLRLNKLIVDSISGTGVSSLQRSLSMTELIYNEEWAKSNCFVSSDDDSDDGEEISVATTADMDEEESHEDDPVEENGEESVTAVMAEAEEAAIAAMMRQDNPTVVTQITEKVEEVAEEISVATTADDGSKSTTARKRDASGRFVSANDDADGTFTPARRRKK